MKKLFFGMFCLLLVYSKIIAQPFSTQTEWEQYFKSKIHDLDPIEGIWSMSSNAKVYNIFLNTLTGNNKESQYAKSAVYKTENNKYKVFDITNNKDGEYIITQTASNGIYLLEHSYLKSNSTVKANANLKNRGILEFNYQLPEAEVKIRMKDKHEEEIINNTKVIIEQEWIKLFPENQVYENAKKNETKLPVSGTGFAISSNGIIVTNYHVIEGAGINKSTRGKF